MKIKLWLSLLGFLVAVPVVTYIVGGLNYISKCGATRSSCLEHRNAGCNINGEYNLGNQTRKTEATCDMETESGGWTLVANYVHKKGSKGGPLALPANEFPVQNKVNLGFDEFGSPSWGHAANSTLKNLNFKELRFVCKTSLHNRVVDFILSEAKCLDTIRTGIGTCVAAKVDGEELSNYVRHINGSKAKIPSIADKGWSDQGANAITNYPFYTDYRHHWSIGALPGRFECDDYEPGNTSSTVHQVWAR